MSEQGTKFDGCKSRIDLIPPAAINLVGEIARHGVAKYGEGNCEQGFKYSRLTGAALRHVNAWQAGQDLDPESGLPHLAHAAWNLMRLIDQQYWGYGEDDRTSRYKDHDERKSDERCFDVNDAPPKRTAKNFVFGIDISSLPDKDQENLMDMIRIHVQKRVVGGGHA